MAYFHSMDAGVLPGVLLAFGFVLCIVVMATFFPTSVMKPTPEGQAEAEGDQMTLTQALLKLVPIATLIALVLGGIYGGLFTPTESGAVGALGAFLLAIVKRRLTFAKLWRVLVETGHITASIAALAIGATMYSRMLALSGLPSHLGMWMAEANLDFYGFIFAFIVIVIFLGTILDSVSIMLVMLPLVLPILTAMNADLVWFGVVTVIAVEIGLLTPPFGLAVFTIKATLNNSKISAADIFIGALPFVLVMILTLAVVVLVPWFTYALL